MKVAVAYPRMPTNSAGMRLLRQPLAAAMPAAVVGPALHVGRGTCAFNTNAQQGTQPNPLAANSLPAPSHGCAVPTSNVGVRSQARLSPREPPQPLAR